MQSFDVVIIGTGMGGLVCGNILALEGLRVCLLEKNKQVGGNLQTFARDKLIFDSGVHYLGGLDKGQNLYQVFRYLGIMDKLKLRKMDEDGFDRIVISGDDKEYVQAQGYENFIRHLVADFPAEEKAIRAYCDKIKEVCSRFPLYNLHLDGSADQKNAVLQEGAAATIASFTADKKLQAVLAGNNLLYAGEGEKTPFYVHALIVNSYIESSWKCINGGSQIAKLLVKNIRDLGGEIHRHTEAVKIVEEDGAITHVQTKQGASFYAKHVVSNIDPVRTLEITDSPLLRELYRNRIKSIPNSISSFSVHLVLKEKAVLYRNHNYYYHREGHVWDMNAYTPENWPLGYALFYTPSEKDPQYAESITILAVMRYEEVAPWQHTFNTTADEQDRGDDYAAFKKQKAAQLLDVVEEKFPGLRQAVATYYTTSPLSYRDYIGSGDGTMYGFAKDVADPLKTFMSPRTRIPNLYLTGQNLNLHGILGTALSGILTSVTLTGNDNIVAQIKNA